MVGAIVLRVYFQSFLVFSPRLILLSKAHEAGCKIRPSNYDSWLKMHGYVHLLDSFCVLQLRCIGKTEQFMNLEALRQFHLQLLKKF